MADLASLLSAGFIQRAFLIGIIIAMLSSILSVFVVLKKMSLIGDGLAHTAFGGLAAGFYLGLTPLWVAGGVVILGSLGITKAVRSAKLSGDAAVAVFLQAGLASGIVLLSLARSFGVNLDTLLFGSIVLVNLEQIYAALAVTGVILAIVFLFMKEMVFTTFDEVQARAAGIRTWVFDYLTSALAAIAVIVAIPIIGVLLISALLVLPALTSVQVSRSFRQTLILSPGFGFLNVILGLFLSIILDTSSGATIVVTGLIVLLVVLLGKTLQRRLTRRSA